MEVGAMKTNAFTPMKEVIMNSFLNTHLRLILAALTCLTCDVYSAPNHAPVANNDAFAVIEDGVLTVATPGVLANDTDADQDPLIAIVVSQPSMARSRSIRTARSLIRRLPTLTAPTA